MSEALITTTRELNARRLVHQRKRLTAKDFRSLRAWLSLSQRELARLFGVTELTLGRWERDQTNIPLAADVLLRVLAAEHYGQELRVQKLAERLGMEEAAK